MAGINCREQFEAIEWLDDLEKIKECPQTARIGDYYKYLLFKFYKGLRYVGVGSVKRVHETMNKTNWNATFLPKDKYWYVHKKSALKIWQRAGENFFICGGGDCVGELNPYWKPFVETCNKYGIATSKDLIDAIVNRKVPEEIAGFFREFISDKPIFATDYGREMRELAKFYYYYHPEKIDKEIECLLKNPPKRDKRTEIEDYVRAVYYRILKRHPDRKGLDYWTQMILEGKILKEQLPEVFRRSKEYKEKVCEEVKLTIPVDIKVYFSEDLILDALRKSDTWWNKIKPKIDLARFIESLVDNVEEFYNDFYKKKELEALDLERFVLLLEKHKSKY